MSELPVFSVGQVNQYIKSLLDRDGTLQGILIEGELSNYKVYPSGHHYFSVKDSTGSLSCVMFRGAASKLRFRPENGMKVLLFGSITVYPRDGKYQLICEQLHRSGVGDLHVAFEQLKEKLLQEGLFDPEHKKALPSYPDTIALITSASGAAVHDMLRILKARWPMTKVLVMGVRVQGAEAPAELVGAIRYANRWKVADLIIIGRGGGSMEDLWAFNDERLARAIYESELPVISAVGHEPDVLISDYVADLRAATPSNAAELAVPDQIQERERLRKLEQRLRHTMEAKLSEAQSRLKRCAASGVLCYPEQLFQPEQQRLDQLQQRLTAGFSAIVAEKRLRVAAASSSLDAMSPLKVLSRGYAMLTDENGAVISSVQQTEKQQMIHIRMSDGSLSATITERRPS